MASAARLGPPQSWKTFHLVPAGMDLDTLSKCNETDDWATKAGRWPCQAYALAR